MSSNIENANLRPRDALDKAIRLHKTGDLETASKIYRHILIIEPGNAEAHNNLGVLLKSLGKLIEAEAHYRSAININPDHAGAHGNLGNLLIETGRILEAETSYSHSIRITPSAHAAHYNLGNVYLAIQKYDAAEICYRRAIQIKPDFAAAYTDLGNTLMGAGRLREAEANHYHALVLNPCYPQAYNNLGCTLAEQGRLFEAIKSFKKATTLEPYFPSIHSNAIFYMNYIDHFSKKEKFHEAANYGHKVSLLATPRFELWSDSTSDDRLRIGFVSGDFREHPVTYFLEGLLSKINRHRFELFAYSMNKHEDETTRRLRTYFDHWHRIFNLSDQQAASLIHHDGVHILIDLAGHSALNRLPTFALKPAPIQASWLGYFATTGMREIDFVIGDPYVCPDRDDADFVERIKRLPETYLCWTPPQIAPEVAPLPAKTNGFITFGCFNNATKLNDDVLALWYRILAAVDGSVLLLKAAQFVDPDFRRRITERMTLFGLSPDRLKIEGRSSRSDYFKAFNQIDIALDPFPFPGGTTSVDGLWMGVPVITKKGNCFIAHNGETIAHNSGQSDWIAQDDADYFAKAIHFSSDLQGLANLRSGLRAQVLASPLFDADRFARNFEKAMFEIWDEYKIRQQRC